MDEFALLLTDQDLKQLDLIIEAFVKQCDNEISRLNQARNTVLNLRYKIDGQARPGQPEKPLDSGRVS